VMLGPGGRFLHPVSESDAISAAIAHVTHGDYRQALDVLKALKAQVRGGYHRNPSSSRLYEPFKIMGVLAKDVHQIKYQHGQNRDFFQHKFDRGSAEILAVVRHGKHEMLITSPQGVKLWDEF